MKEKKNFDALSENDNNWRLLAKRKKTEIGAHKDYLNVVLCDFLHNPYVLRLIITARKYKTIENKENTIKKVQ